MDSEAVLHPHTEGNVELDDIHFDDNENDNALTTTSNAEKTEHTDNEIDWEDKAEIPITEGQATMEIPMHSDNAVTTEGQEPQEFGNQAAEGHDISYDLDINIGEGHETEPAEENEIDYEDHTEPTEAETKAVANESLGHEIDESLNAEAADGVVIDSRVTEVVASAEDQKQNEDKVEAQEDEHDQSGVSLGDEDKENEHNGSQHDSSEGAEGHDIGHMDAEDDDGFPTSMLVPDITVRYNGEEYPLFHGQNNIDTQMGFFHDQDVLDAPIDDVFLSFRHELEDDLDDKDELVLQIDDLGLQYAESTNPSILSSVTLRQLYNVLLKLSQNQNPDFVPTMYTFLNTRLNSTKRLTFLLQEAYSGTSLDSVAHRFPGEQTSHDSPDDGDEEMEQAEDYGDEDEDQSEQDEEQDEEDENEGEDEEGLDAGEEEEEDDEDEITADDLDAAPAEQHYEDHGDIQHQENNPDEYLDLGDGGHGEPTMVERNLNEFIDHEEGGVSVDSMDFAIDGTHVDTAGLDLSLGLEAPLDGSLAPTFDAAAFNTDGGAAGEADMDEFLDMNGNIGEATAENGDVTADVSSITEHGDEITYDEDDDGHAGVSLDVGKTSAMSEVNDKGKRPHLSEEADENDAKRLRA